MARLTENLIREISAKRGEPDWLLQWRLGAYNAWKKMTEPHWGNIKYSPIDYDSLDYYNKVTDIDNSDLGAIYDKMGLQENEKKELIERSKKSLINMVMKL